MPLVRYDYQGDTLTAAVDSLGHAKHFAYEAGRLIRHTDKNKLVFSNTVFHEKGKSDDSGD
jgi:hypothetical protein